MKRFVTGILSHVDAGKTTLIEAMLYLSGKIRTLGRVDNQNTLLDYNEQERSRGITIYSKQANLNWKNNEIYLIDTPGHVDFSSEMERALQILDIAVMLINAQDGIQSHSKTIWECLKHYSVPTILFINKMDIAHLSREELLAQLKNEYSDNIIDFGNPDYLDHLAMVNETMMNEYLETGTISKEAIVQAVYNRECFPVYFGSALKLEGVENLMDGICTFALEQEYPKEFGAVCYKITHNDSGKKITHLKITGGTLQVKDKISENEKIDQIYVFNGAKLQPVDTAYPGMVVGVSGLENCEAGSGLGFEKNNESSLLQSFLNYQLVLPEEIDAIEMMKILKPIEAEDPQLHISFDKTNGQISVSLMGDIQMEVLQKRVLDQTGKMIQFSQGNIIYKETISKPVYGYGHFEPLRHYAEVHLLIEPLPRGKGIQYESKVPLDELALNWQNLILTHLKEKEHKGVLTGSSLTDVKYTLINGKAHNKHTEGGDFRQATYRAVRQGLMKADSILLEPYYSFKIEFPADAAGKILFDLENNEADFEIDDSNETSMQIKGQGPVRLWMNYQRKLTALTKGLGRFTANVSGYFPVQNQEQILKNIDYDPLADLENPSDSIFCARGAGYSVPYDEVEEHLHLPTIKEKSQPESKTRHRSIDQEEVLRVFNMAGGQNKNKEEKSKKFKKNTKPVAVPDSSKLNEITAGKPVLLIVDGYNMIYAWQDLKQIAKTDLFNAREALISYLVNYTGYKEYELIVVFDGYRQQNNPGSNIQRGNLTVVYTRYSQTADSYIEKKVKELQNEYKMIVATSDGMIQNSILSHGAQRMSAEELESRCKNVNSLALSHLKS